MAIYNLINGGINEVPKTNYQANGILERNHLQKYLKDKIDIIYPDLLVTAEEFSEWSEGKRRIDLLGIDKEANLVVIELKRTESGDHMELQALRYASMISTMSFDKCVSVYQNYLNTNQIEKDAKEELLNFLEWDSTLDEDFALSVKIILASADFSKELTTSVLWLISKGIDITCVKLTPYLFNSEVLLDVNQIIPLPEAENYLIKIQEKNLERAVAIQSSKDNTKYIFNDLTLGKSRLVLEVIRQYVKDNPILTFENLKLTFPNNLQGSVGTINLLEVVESKYSHSHKKRHFMNDTDIPILRKIHELYKTFHEYRVLVPKHERFSIYERSENAIVDILELVLEASYVSKEKKVDLLEKASVRLNVVRFFIRLMKESKTLDMKKYTVLQTIVDEIGRMLGGWMRSSLTK